MALHLESSHTKWSFSITTRSGLASAGLMNGEWVVNAKAASSKLVRIDISTGIKQTKKSTHRQLALLNRLDLNDRESSIQSSLFQLDLKEIKLQMLLVSSAEDKHR